MTDRTGEYLLIITVIVLLKKLREKYNVNPADFLHHFSSDSCAQNIRHIHSLLAQLSLSSTVEFDESFKRVTICEDFRKFFSRFFENGGGRSSSSGGSSNNSGGGDSLPNDDQFWDEDLETEPNSPAYDSEQEKKDALKWQNFLKDHDDDILKLLRHKYEGNPEEFFRHFSSDSCAKDIHHLMKLLADLSLDPPV